MSFIKDIFLLIIFFIILFIVLILDRLYICKKIPEYLENALDKLADKILEEEI